MKKLLIVVVLFVLFLLSFGAAYAQQNLYPPVDNCEFDQCMRGYYNDIKDNIITKFCACFCKEYLGPFAETITKCNDPASNYIVDISETYYYPGYYAMSASNIYCPKNFEKIEVPYISFTEIGICFLCTVDIVHDIQSFCWLDSCIFYPCANKCAQYDNVSEWIYYCKGNDLYKKRYHYLYSCTDIDLAVGKCIVDDSRSYWEHKKDKTCLKECKVDRCFGECNSDQDCKPDKWINLPYCNNDDVWQKYREFICENPGTDSSKCVYNEYQKEKKECGQYGCINGECSNCLNPTNEVCYNNIDDDCDDLIDEDCSCQSGETKECGIDIGECEKGTQTCTNGQWGECIGKLGPFSENCPKDNLDNDCDGLVDEDLFCETAFCKNWDANIYGTESYYIREVQFGPYCAGGYKWHIHDVDNDGYSEHYMLVNDRYSVWMRCKAQDGYIVNDFTNYDGTASYGCNGGCDYQVEYNIYSHTYTQSAPRISYPERYCKVCPNDNYCVSWGWHGGDLWWYFDTNNNGEYDEGEHQEFGMVLNCGVDEDCKADEYCYKADSTPWHWYCIKRCGDGICEQGENCPQDGSGFEVCDNVDNDCDGSIDENLTRECGESNYGVCKYGTQTCLNGSWNGCEGNIDPSEEICDGLDNNCNSFVDEANVCGDYPNTTIEYPENNFVSHNGKVEFRCSGYDEKNLSSIILALNINNKFDVNKDYETINVTNDKYFFRKNVSGKINSSSFVIKNIPNATRFNWTCIVYDNDSHINGADERRNVTVVYYTPPTQPYILEPKPNKFYTDSITIKWTESIDEEDVMKGMITYDLDYSNNPGLDWYNIVENYGYENKLNDGVIEKNLTFEMPDSKIVYAKLPKDGKVTNANLSLSGYGVYNREDVNNSLIIDGITMSLCGNHVYNNIEIINSGILKVCEYDGTEGTGILNLTAIKSIFIDSTSSIIADKVGYQAGQGLGHGDSGSNGGDAGPCRPGAGGGGGGAGVPPGTETGRFELIIGGGAGNGGSGGHGYGGCGTPGSGGSSGQRGGGAIYLSSYNITIQGVISAVGGIGGNGGNGGKGDCETQGSAGGGGGGGGGATGGTIIIEGENVNISDASIKADGGESGSGGGFGPMICGRGNYGSSGKKGAGGRIKIFYKNLENSSSTISVEGDNPGTVYYGDYGLFYFSFPSNVEVDVLDDGFTDWDISEINLTNSPQNIEINPNLIQEYIDGCVANLNNYCDVPIKISSDSKGIVMINDIDLYFNVSEYIWNTTNLSKGKNYRVRIKASDGYFDTGYDISDDFKIKIIDTYNISLVKGWNLISIPLELENNSLGYAFSSIKGNYVNIFGYFSDWQELNESSSINETLGFWIKMLSNDTLTINGTLFELPINFTLKQGYNLISYPTLNESNATYVFENVNNSLINVLSYENNTWYSYSPSKNNQLNTLKKLKPGYGYFVNVNDNVTWVFDGKFS